MLPETPHPLPASAVRLLSGLRVSLALILLALGLVHATQLVSYSQYYRGVAGPLIGAVAFLAFAACLFAPWTWARWTAAWIGGLLALQCLLTPLVREVDFISLPPDVVETIDVRGDGMPGIAGIQRITTDDHGFRTNARIDYARPAAGLRVFTVGGSTTEEIHHDDHRTWSYLLGERLEQTLGRDVEVANTGVSGTRTPHHYATLEHILPFHPDVVIFLIGVNDWNEQVRRVESLGPDRSPESFAVLEAHRRLRALTLGESLLAVAIGRMKASRLLGSAAAAAAPRIERGEYYTRQNHSLERPRRIELRLHQVDPIFDAYLRRIAATCHGARILCVFVTQPNGYRSDTTAEYRARFWMTPPNADYTLDLASLEAVAGLYDRHVVQLGRDLGIPVCDVADGIEASFRHFYDEVHLNLEGSRRLADLLAPCVAEALASEARGAVT
jgi:lysophospholipase L1-like esterase